MGNICTFVPEQDKSNKLILEANQTYFCIFRFSNCMNLVDFSAYKYVHNPNVPLYKLQKNHYYFDIDNPIGNNVNKFNIEYSSPQKQDVWISNYYGEITNFKIFDVYNDQIAELLQMYPTHQHLMINDTARKILGQKGVAL